LFIGSLANEVDERLLSDTFSAFGLVIDSKVAIDPDTGSAKGYGFVSFDSFEASDAAIEAMNGQFLCNKPITVQYALKKDGKGERHGTAAERLLAMQARKAGITVAQAAVQAPQMPYPPQMPPMGFAGYPPPMPGQQFYPPPGAPAGAYYYPPPYAGYPPPPHQ
jgi:splicing factor 3B subunit 4